MSPKRNFTAAVLGGVAAFAVILIVGLVVRGGNRSAEPVVAQQEAPAAPATVSQ